MELFDKERSLAFPTIDGRELVLTVNLESGFATISERLDGEEDVQQISTSCTELRTLAYYIRSLEEEQDRRKLANNKPFLDAM